MIHLWVAVQLLLLLALMPVMAFLCSGWKVRRQSIMDGFTEVAIESYFRAFHPREEDGDGGKKLRFGRYYSSQFGRRRFVLPLILLACIGGLLLCWSARSIPGLLENGKVGPGSLPTLAILAVMGAYMWVAFDEITRWYSSDLSPNDIYWWCFRFAIAVPMGYAVADVFTPTVAGAIAFLVGAFPTAQLMALARRIATRKLGFADADNREVSELQSLQGIDLRKAERFAAEGITTILQLAYSDPIRLTIRTGLSYSYITDCTCQALLWVYVDKNISLLAKSGLRSAYEVLDLWLDLEDPQEKDRAGKVLHEAATAVGCPDESLWNLLRQVALDPYTQFLYLSWSGFTTEDFTPHQLDILGVGEEKDLSAPANEPTKPKSNVTTASNP